MLAFFNRVSKGYKVPSNIFRFAAFISSTISEGYASPRFMIDRMQNSRIPFRIWLCVFSIFILSFFSLALWLSSESVFEEEPYRVGNYIMSLQEQRYVFY